MDEPASAIQPPPGWWLASDGRWYAPGLHPDARSSATGAALGAGTGPAAIGHLPTSTHRDGPPDGRRALRSPWVWGTGLATVAILAVLVVTGPGEGSGTKAAAPAAASSAVAGRSGSSGVGTLSPGSTKGAPSGAAALPTTPPTTTPPAPAAAAGAAAVAASPGTASEVAAGPAGGDVSVSQCVVDPTNPRRAVVNGTVDNHDIHTDDYTITVAIGVGGQTVGSAFVTDDQVAEGATSPWSASGTLTSAANGNLTCIVSFVQRASS